jgi:excinuclease ABC subunit B
VRIPFLAEVQTIKISISIDPKDPKMLFKQADEIEKTMLEHARNLEFEDAARLRDELEDIRNTAMGIND